VIETLESIRLVEIVDLAVVWALVWAGIAWVRATPARPALIGLGILVAGYLAVRQLGLVLTTWILQGFAAVATLIAVVVFQQDLRRMFEQIAAVGLRRRMLVAGPDTVDTLVRAIANLAENRRGALIVIPGREPLEGHVDGGIALDGKISEPLLLSLFDPHSAGHDGAVLLRGSRASRFAAHLPLSTDHAQLGSRGTRHAAALGLAERCDAMCIAVSEERGTVSVARDGVIQTLAKPNEVAAPIRDFLDNLSPREGRRRARVWSALAHWREGVLALPVAALLWFLAVPGATVIEDERMVAVTVGGIPADYQVEYVDPPSVALTLSGRRIDLFLLAPEAVEVRVNAVLVELGRRSFVLTPDNVRHPEGIEVRSIQPDSVKISLREKDRATTP